MQDRWDDNYAQGLKDELSLRVYSSRLLGQEASLVLHGGGNTSVKTEETNLLGESHRVLRVKGSGWDLETIEAAGFPAVKMEVLLKLAQLNQLSDSDMVREQRAAMVDPFAPNPSVEAILHAIIPYKYVDHTHADAILSISNSPNGESLLREILGQKVVVVPYVMPGFILAKAVMEITRDIDWRDYEGMLLLKHGLFSFADDAKTSYQRMIDMVSKAERYLDQHASTALGQTAQATGSEWSKQDLLNLCQLRQSVSLVQGAAQLAICNNSAIAKNLAQSANLASGPMTPDHVIRTKPLPLIVDEKNIDASVKRFADQYKSYFQRHCASSPVPLNCLDAAPRWALWPGKGSVSFAATVKDANIVADITSHTMEAILRAQALGGWAPLGEKDIFDMEYWELEQAKLGKSVKRPEFLGKVVLVTGAANGIGRACCEHFIKLGAAVIGLDINEAVESCFTSQQVMGIRCDVSDAESLAAALESGVARFGGLDIVIFNAGIFPSSLTLAEMEQSVWQKSLDINLTSQQRLLSYAIPFLRYGLDANVIFVASKNVPAPGPGAAAYSVAKAGVTQLARVAALELAPMKIRVNIIHPDAVFDTSIWSDEVLSKRAAHYNMSVDEYKTKNLLKTEIRSSDVAALIAAIAGPAFSKTTAAQIPIDGGNDRVV